MAQSLSPHQLTVNICPDQLGFAETSQLLENDSAADLTASRWIGQADAEKAARFGLSMQQPGFHLLVLGAHGTGRTSLMLSTMQQIAKGRPTSPDLVMLYHFDTPEKPTPLYLKAGEGASLRAVMDAFIRQLAKTLPLLVNETPSEISAETPVQVLGDSPAEALEEDAVKPGTDKPISDACRQAVQLWLDEQLLKLGSMAEKSAWTPTPLKQPSGMENSQTGFAVYIQALRQDVLDSLELFSASMNNADNEGLLEGFLGRYRLNLMVDNRALNGAPVIYDDDPSLPSLFGGYEGSNDSNSGTADFMRLRAGNLLRAHGGCLMLHLRDIHADQQAGSQILEKLHRVLRNSKVQIEESGGTSGQSSASHFSPDALPVDVKLVLLATREEYYALHEELPDFAPYFNIKVDFSERFDANAESYRYIAQYVALQCQKLNIRHFSAEAVARLIAVMHRKIDDQTRVSANFGYLQGLLFEAHAFAEMRSASLVELQDVESALAARLLRYQQPEQHMAEAIADGELMVSVQGTAVGQINGLTHIDLGDACFGSPVRISARCYAGDEGVINIDREVEMTGPNHDKGLFILRSWLSATFPQLTPLSLSASLVFEQEYQGVEGDSASCAELYALLSALSALPIPQGLAVTGAMNQHGDVMAIGGVNEKIEGYYRICKRLGLDGSQGVLIPAHNRSHLMLNADVVQAVEQGNFHIYTVDSVLDGISLLTGLSADAHDDNGDYLPDSLLGMVQNRLELLRKIYGSNRLSQTTPRNN